MASPHWDDDDVLLRDLADALTTVRRAASRVRQIGEDAFTWHGIDEELELATLAYDSLLDSELLVRGATDEPCRTVLFESSSASVQVEKTADLLVGQVVPAECGDVSIISAAGDVTSVRADDLGCFCLETPPERPIRLRWQAAEANLITDWITL